MIAVFTRYQRDYEELELTPPKEFKRIKDITDVMNCEFSGIIKLHDWYKGSELVAEAYYRLRATQRHLFEYKA